MPAIDGLDPSARLGLLSFALSAWVEGSAQLRTVLIMFNTDASPSLPMAFDQLHANEWIINFLHWLTRRSRELDYGEQRVIAGLDLTSALALLKFLQIKPLLPFLLTPILATVPLPKSFNAQSLKAVQWLRVAFVIFLATIVGESNKVTTLHLLRLWRRQQAIRRKLELGKIVARGVPLGPPAADEEGGEETECLICSGAGTDEVDPMAQSVSSLSSLTFEAGSHGDRHNQTSGHVDAFGPLEGFCKTAPRKHALHRECGLRWVETYRQQHLRVFLEPVHVQVGDIVDTQSTQSWDRKEKSRIGAFLQAAGFDHMSQSLIFPTRSRDAQNATSHNSQSLGGEAPASSRRPGRTRSSTLTITSPTEVSATTSNAVLGTLSTSSPSCPACRGPVNIIFAQEPVNSHPRVSSTSPLLLGLTPVQRYLRTAKLLKWFMRGWWKEFLASVTGRSLLVRLVAQYSFLLVLVSMIKASGRARQKK